MAYAKTIWQDEVKDQNGNIIQSGTPLSAKNMNNIEEGVDLGVNVEGALIAELFSKVGNITKELDKWSKQRLQQGIINLYNKYVISGCIVSAMANSRYLQVSKSGTFTSGDVSEIYVDGVKTSLKDEQMVCMVPQNVTNSPAYYYVYVDYDASQKRYRIYFDTTIPEGKLGLYKATVPANDTSMDLSAVTLTDLRRIENKYPVISTEPYSIVSIPGYPMIDNDYDVVVTVESASSIGAVGNLIVYNKQMNGFSIKSSGSADNIKLHWTVVNPDLK